MSDRSQRTEKPTPRRLEKAREEGQYPSTREFVSALQFLFFVTMLGAGGAEWFAEFRRAVRVRLAAVRGPDLTAVEVVHVWRDIVLRQFGKLVLAGLVLVALTLGLRLMATRFGLSLNRLAPDLKRLNPLTKLKELPSQNLPVLFQSLLLLPLFLGVVWAIASDHLESFLLLPLRSVDAGMRLVADSVRDLFWKAAGLFLVFGAVDLFRQLRRHQQDLSMTKQEVREESKESEGNPQMKGRIRRMQRERGRRQMMQQVATATAVVVNPTHYAVAIRYQMESMAAPMVVAKGRNYLAQRIRQKAIEHEVPIIENPPLARALYAAAEVGQEIPAHLYRAVAEILAYIFKLMKGRLPR